MQLLLLEDARCEGVPRVELLLDWRLPLRNGHSGVSGHHFLALGVEGGSEGDTLQLLLHSLLQFESILVFFFLVVVDYLPKVYLIVLGLEVGFLQCVLLLQYLLLLLILLHSFRRFCLFLLLPALLHQLVHPLVDGLVSRLLCNAL